MTTYLYETIPKRKGQKARRFEVEQRMSDPPLKKDPKTGLPVRRVIVGGSGLVSHGASILSMNVKRSKR
jgi:predicted nucleic acid-binding Zn ribbon protein